MRKSNGILWVSLLMLSLLLVSCANNEKLEVMSMQGEVNRGKATLVTDSKEDAQEVASQKGVMPEGIQFTNSRQQGKSAFNNTFTSSPENGKELNVQVKNNNSSGIVIFKVLKDSQDFGFVDVSAGEEINRAFTMKDGSGMSGDWEVYVTTRDGHSMDINVEAGQY